MKGQDFEEWRKRLGLSQDEAADLLGAGRRSVVGWESGERPISQAVELSAHHIEQRALMRRELEMLRSGQMTTGSKELIGNRVVDRDTTTETIERLERQIAELDSILARQVAAAVDRIGLTCNRDGEKLVRVRMPIIDADYAICPNCWSAGNYAQVAGGAGLIASLRISDGLKELVEAFLVTR